MAKTDELLTLANSFLYDGKYADVIALLPDKLLDELDNAELYFCRAWAHYQLNEDKMAITFSKKAMIADPDIKYKFNRYGTELFNKGEINKAITEYDKAILADKDFSIAFYNMGLALNNKKDYDKAIINYSKAILLNPKYSNSFIGRGLAWYYKGEFDNAISDYNKAIELDKNNSIIYYNRGLVWYDKKDYDKAISDFEKSLLLKDDYKEAYLYRGLGWYYKADYPQAIADYNKAIKLDENYTIAYYNRGLAWYNIKEYEKAVADYNKTLELNPEYASAYVSKGLIWYYKGDYDKSIADYNKAIELNSNYVIAYNNRGLAWHYKGEYDKAIADYDKVLTLDLKYTDAYINRGIAYYYKGEYNEAIEDYKKAINLDDSLEFVYNNIGLAYYNKGYYLEAIENYNKALELKPDYPDALNNRGMAWYEKGDYDKAIEDCTKVIEISPNYADAYNNRGNAWYFKEDFDNAEADFYKVADFLGFEAIGNTNLGDVCSSRGEFQKANDFYEKAGKFANIPEWLDKQLVQKLERNLQKINLAKSNVPVDRLIKKTRIDDRIERTLENIRKVAKSDTRRVVHYTKLFVSEIYVTSLNSKMHYSNAIYMNDPLEGKVFFDYLNDNRILEAYTKGEKRNESSVYLGSFLPAEDSLLGKSYEDELVMWRTYGKDVNGKEAAGCNLILSSDFFKQRKKPAAAADHSQLNTDQNLEKVATIKEEYSKNKTADEELLNVIYIDIHQNDRNIKNDPTGNIKPALLELKRQLHSLIELRDERDTQIDFNRSIENTIFKQLSTISFLFKSADYIFENEVRVIEYVPRDSDLIKFMEVKEPNLPKKRFYIESTNEILPFIKKIHLGPKVENHQQWSLYFDFEIRQRAKEIANMASPPYELNPSDIAILKSECKFQ